jgi:hypothetical protein
MHSTYFPGQGQVDDTSSVNADVSAGYNVYGFQFIPGQSFTTYFDGSQVWQLDASNAVTLPAEPYEIILDLELAWRTATGWHYLTTASTPSASMDVAEVQAYSYP